MVGIKTEEKVAGIFVASLTCSMSHWLYILTSLNGAKFFGSSTFKLRYWNLRRGIYSVHRKGNVVDGLDPCKTYIMFRSSSSSIPDAAVGADTANKDAFAMEDEEGETENPTTVADGALNDNNNNHHGDGGGCDEDGEEDDVDDVDDDDEGAVQQSSDEEGDEQDPNGTLLLSTPTTVDAAPTPLPEDVRYETYEASKFEHYKNMKAFVLNLPTARIPDDASIEEARNQYAADKLDVDFDILRRVAPPNSTMCTIMSKLFESVLFHNLWFNVSVSSQVITSTLRGKASVNNLSTQTQRNTLYKNFGAFVVWCVAKLWCCQEAIAMGELTLPQRRQLAPLMSEFIGYFSHYKSKRARYTDSFSKNTAEDTEVEWSESMVRQIRAECDDLVNLILRYLHDVIVCGRNDGPQRKKYTSMRKILSNILSHLDLPTAVATTFENDFMSPYGRRETVDLLINHTITSATSGSQCRAMRDKLKRCHREFEDHNFPIKVLLDHAIAQRDRRIPGVGVPVLTPYDMGDWNDKATYVDDVWFCNRPEKISLFLTKVSSEDGRVWYMQTFMQNGKQYLFDVLGIGNKDEDLHDSLFSSTKNWQERLTVCGDPALQFGLQSIQVIRGLWHNYQFPNFPEGQYIYIKTGPIRTGSFFVSMSTQENHTQTLAADIVTKRKLNYGKRHRKMHESDMLCFRPFKQAKIEATVIVPKWSNAAAPSASTTAVVGSPHKITIFNPEKEEEEEEDDGDAAAAADPLQLVTANYSTAAATTTTTTTFPTPPDDDDDDILF